MAKRPKFDEKYAIPGGTKAQKEVAKFLRWCHARGHMAKYYGGVLRCYNDSTYKKKITCKVATIQALMGEGRVGMRVLHGGLLLLWELPNGALVQNDGVRKHLINEFYERVYGGNPKIEFPTERVRLSE